MRILCDVCGEPLLDSPLGYFDKHTRIATPVADRDAHATTYHRDGRVVVEVRDDLGQSLAYGHHEHAEAT